MSKLLYIPRNKTVRIVADLDKLPAEIELPRRKTGAVWLLVFAGTWSFGVPMLMFYAMTGDFTARTGVSKLIPFSVAFAITMFILYLSWVALRQYSSNDRVSFHQDRVDVVEYHFFTKTGWSALYTEFSGLGLREQSAAPRDGKARDYHIIELIHPNTKKSIPLFAGSVPHKNYVVKLARDYSKKLGVPVL